MINTSNEYKKYIADSIDFTLSRNFRVKADIELVDGTVLNITGGDIVVGGLKINDATSANNSFQIGAAIINQCTLMLNNIGGKFDQYDFTDAVIRPYIGLKLLETTEWLKKGVFTVDEPTLASSIISLVALDNMNKFDTPFSDVAISFPCTQLQLLQEVCLHCGVYLTNATFTNSNFVVTRRPDDEAITCREIVAWIAQNSGNFARCNTDGALELKWYDITAFEQSDSLDGGIFDSDTPYSSGDVANGGDFTFSEIDNYDGGTFLQMEKYHHIYALNQATIGTDDVIITGIQVKAQGTQSDYGETVLFGDKGYVIEITNPLITENTASIIANSVGAKIVGMRFRPCTVSALSDPSREAGDVAYLSHKGSTYQILLTNVSYQIGGNNSISCDAETPSKKQSVRFDASTKAIVEARKQAKQEISSYDLAIQQLTSLMTNSFGVFKSEEILEDGSIVYYMHDKPTLAESQTIWKMTANTFTVSTNGGQTWNAGIDSSGNAVVNVLNAIGINAEWVRAGMLMSTNGESYFDLDNNKIKTSNAEITGGTVDIETSGEEVSRIKTNYKQFSNQMQPRGIYAENSELNVSSILQAGGLWLYKEDKNTLTINGTSGQIVATGSIFTDRQIQAKDTIRAAKRLAAGDLFYEDYMLSIYGGDAYISGSLSAETIIDRTPYYDGNALEELSRVKDDGNGGIDHSTLPKFAQIKISTEKAPMESDLVNKKNKLSTTMNETKEDNIEQEHVEGRDIGAMVSVLTKGIQELISRNEKQDRIIEEQGSQIKQLQEKLGG